DTDEARKALPLTVTRKLETGDLFDVVTTEYEVRQAATAANGTPLRFAFMRRQRTDDYELGTSPRTTLKEWDRDQYGNITHEALYGEVVGGDPAGGDDETIIDRSYAINESEWI